MRLGQLARQLDIKTSKIVSFLEKEKQITIKSHPNAKVDDDLIEEITNYFAPKVEDEITEVVITKKVKEDIETIGNLIVEEIKEPEHIATVKPKQKELKIVGKIDMPDKSQIQIEIDGVVYDQATLDQKKKEELKVERERKELEKEAKIKEEKERKKKAQEQRKIEQERLAMLETEKHHILTKEEERKKKIILKAQQERERKLEEKRKSKQKEHYAKKHAATTSVKSKKIKKSVQIEENNIEDEVQEKDLVKLNAFQKFIKWLNT